MTIKNNRAGDKVGNVVASTLTSGRSPPACSTNEEPFSGSPTSGCRGTATEHSRVPCHSAAGWNCSGCWNRLRSPERRAHRGSLLAVVDASGSRQRGATCPARSGQLHLALGTPPAREPGMCTRGHTLNHPFTVVFTARH